MKNSKRNKRLLACLVIATVILLGQMVYGEVKAQDVERDLAIAADLSVFSGMTDEIVLKIYETIYDWDTVSENILVYRKILSYMTEESEEYDKAISYIGDYDSDILLAICEYLDKNGKGMDGLEKILKEYDKGEDLEKILSMDLGQGEYLVYMPASKEDIRKWLATGYSPQDIIDADAIATQDDLDLGYILSTYYSTSGEAIDMDITTGEAIDMEATTKEAVDLDLIIITEETDPDQTTSIEAIDLTDSTTLEAIELTIKTGSKTEEKITAKDYKTLVEDMKDKADKEKKDKTDKILKKYGMDTQTFAEYEKLGLNIHEIENAYKLAKEDEAKAAEILAERLDGADWPDLISKYLDKEVKEDEKVKEAAEDENASSTEEGDGER